MESDCVPEIPPDLEAESAVTVRRRRKKATIKVADADLDKASKYFVREGDSAKCNIIDCNSSLCRWTAYYLKRHLQLKHFSIYAELFAGEIDVGIKSRIDAFTTMQNAVTLVTSDGYPFFLLDRPAFRALIQPGLDNLAKYGQIVTINRAEIVQQIAIVSNEVRNHIKSELQNRFVSVMLDITTKSTLSVLGVNVSFIENDVVIIRSLGVINMTERHTGENIALVVQELFSVFDLPITNIFAITTDNGANMVKCTVCGTLKMRLAHSTKTPKCMQFESRSQSNDVKFSVFRQIRIDRLFLKSIDRNRVIFAQIKHTICVKKTESDFV